jgi:hypothetical protein
VVALDRPNEAYAQALRSEGARFEEHRAGELRLFGDAREAAGLALRAARSSGAVVRRLERGRNSLEDIYLAAVGGAR